MKVSILIPVYRTPKFLGDILAKILGNEYPDKEIIVAVDGVLTKEIEEALNPFNDKIVLYVPNQHVGKARLLNEAVLKLDTDILVFFDNDILLPDDPQFLHRLTQTMQSYDIVEMAKEVFKESFYSTMISYEYIGFSIVHYLFSVISERLPSVIGSAFAVKKELFDQLGGFQHVVHEDVDFGARAFRLNARYTYSIPLKVKTTMPNTVEDWITQRKRWTLINIMWFKDNIGYLVLKTFSQPSLLPTILLTLSPFLCSLLVFFFFDQSKLVYFSSAVFLMTQSQKYLYGVFLWATNYAMITKGVLNTIVGFLITFGMYYTFSRLGKYRFNFFEFLCYYFIYMPVIVLFHIMIFFWVIVKKPLNLEWKVSN
jgi:cellulose synthase/poly-beta-1,6-N-acetylglucosamine synthase-like glycosyltransferase